MNDIEKYYDLILSMTLDVKSGKINGDLYISNLDMIVNKLKDNEK